MTTERDEQSTGPRGGRVAGVTTERGEGPTGQGGGHVATERGEGSTGQGGGHVAGVTELGEGPKGGGRVAGVTELGEGPTRSGHVATERGEGSAVPRGGFFGHVLVGLFLVLWAFPVLWHGAVSQKRLPGDPRWLHGCHDIACLFSDRPSAWHTYYVQVRVGEGPWQTLELAPYFAMEPFGYRTRLHRFLINWGTGHEERRAELAAWLFERHRALHPEARQPTALRFAYTWTVPRADAPPQGRWRAPRIEEVAANRLRVLSVHTPEGT